MREAVALANSQAGDDTINFNVSLPATITLTKGEIQVASNIDMKGPGALNYTLADDLIISANDASRIFHITGVRTVTVSGLTLTGGWAADPGAILGGASGSALTLDTMRVINNSGGGVLNQFGSLTVINSTFTNNNAFDGGAIYHDGTILKVQSSTFNNNHSTRAFVFGGDGFGGGAIFTEDPTVISNSTFSGNTTAGDGGAVLFFGTSLDTLVMRNCTVTGNTASGYAGGVANFGDGGGTVANNIIALNTDGKGIPNYYDGGTINEISNYTGNAPNLGPLADNGGPTQTHALQANSPAIDAGNSGQALDINGNALITDQRGTGFARALDGPDVDTTATVDIGAFEFGTTLFVVTKNADTSDGTCDSDCSLREAVIAANAQSGSKVITFSPGLSGLTITLTKGEIQISTNMTILGLGQGLLTVNGNDASRIFTITSGTTVTIGGLTLTNGNGTGNDPVIQGGGAIRAGGTLLTLDTVRIVNNPAGSTVGGGVYVPAGALTVINSTFSNNTALAGGGIYHDGTTLKVRSSTFNGNTATSPTDNGGGGGIYTDDPTVISNSTFSGNSTGLDGGGVYFVGSSLDTLIIRNSTFTGNAAARFAGGVGNFSDGGGMVANTILSLNTAPQLPNYYDGGSITEINNYTGNTPNLGPLADNGGPTQTHGLISNSPALDAGSNAQALDENGNALTTDQRGTGFPRFLDGPDVDSTVTVDQGAFEGVVALANLPPVNSVPGPQVITEDTTRTFSTPNGNLISISDPDAGANPVQVKLTATNGTITLSGIAGLSFTIGDGTADTTMTFTGTVASINTALDGLTFAPTHNFNGAASLQITTNDQGNTGAGGAQQDTDTINITVNAVNDAPSFTKGADQTANNSNPQTIPNWATDISPGPVDESGQAVNFIVSNNNNALFSVQPSIDPSGTLTYTPAPGASGAATVTVQIHDNGGTALGGQDTSAPQVFIITISPTGWTTTAASGVTEDESNPAFLTYTNFTAAANSGSPAGTYVLRYNITAIDNLTALGATNTRLRVRFRDDGDGSQVTVSLMRSPITGGATALGTIFDSDAYEPGSGFQTKEILMPAVTFDFTQHVYWLEVRLMKSTTTNQPGFASAQVNQQ